MDIGGIWDRVLYLDTGDDLPIGWSQSKGYTVLKVNSHVLYNITTYFQKHLLVAEWVETLDIEGCIALTQFYGWLLTSARKSQWKNWSTAMLAAKRLAGVASEVDLSNP